MSQNATPYLKLNSVKYKIYPDFKYNSFLITKFINYLMQDGKKSTAMRIFYNALDISFEKAKEKEGNENLDILDFFYQSINNVSLRWKLSSTKVRGANQQVPRQISHESAVAAAMKRIISVSRLLKFDKKYKNFETKLSDTILDAFFKRGAIYKKKEDLMSQLYSLRMFINLGNKR